MRKADSVEQLRNIVDAVVSELPGGMPGLVTTLVEHAKEGGHSQSRIAKTLLHVACMCELAEISSVSQQAEATPETTVRRLHQECKLAPVLQKMFDAGELSLDDVDPPPFTPPE